MIKFAYCCFDVMLLIKQNKSIEKHFRLPSKWKVIFQLSLLPVLLKSSMNNRLKHLRQKCAEEMVLFLLFERC